MDQKKRAHLTVGLAWAMTALVTPANAGPADDALKALKDGNARFVADTPLHPNSGLRRVAETGSGQEPFVTIMGCSDSRVPIERVFDQGVGDIFVIRVAGNVSDTDEVGSVEYGVGHLGTPLLVILGHTKCGAVTAVAAGAQVHGSIPALVDNIVPAVETARKKHPGVTGQNLVSVAIDENVWQSIADTFRRSEEIRGLVKEGKLQVVGAVYDIDTGKVNWLGEHPEQSALLAAPVSSTPMAASPSAGHGAAASEHTTTVSGLAAEASKIASTGAFSPPEVKVIQRAAFGPGAGQADASEPIKPAAIDSGVFFNIFAGSAALALLLTVGAAFSLSRTTKADGSPGRALTLGTKLAGGFGAVVTGILVVSMLSSRASSSVANSMAEAEHIGDQDILVLNMVNDMWATRTFVNHFLMTNSDEDLVRYSDSTAAFVDKFDIAKEAMKDPERAKIIENIGGLMEEYEHKFAEVVKLIDERNAIVDVQMGPSAERASALMNEIALTAHTDGDDHAGFTAAETNEKFQEARLAFFKFLRQGDEQFAKDAVKHAEETKHELALLESQVRNPNRKAWLKEAGEAITFWISRMENAEKLQEERNELVKKGLDNLGPQIADAGAEILGSLHEDKVEITSKAHAMAAAAKMQTAMVSGVVAVMGAILALVIARGIIKGLKLLEARLKDISQGEGDLTKRVDIASRDEIGLVAQWFNVFVDKIEKVVAEVKAGALQIDAGGTQIASASQSLAQGASEQASSLQQISASLEQISGQTQQSAENARQANTLAEEAKKAADRGQQEMSQMSQAVNEIKQSSGEISKIIKVIDEIAFQTNLLALNAAVEAARAGEAGKGFAVVAEEVRNLAQRSAEAAKNTSGMIEESVKRSENGVQIAGRVGQALEEITASTNKVNTLLGEIASAAGEQSTGVGQINQGVGQLDLVTQQNAGNSEELASSAEELSSQVASLNELVAQFKVSNEGHATAPRPTTTKSRPPAPAQPVKSSQTSHKASRTHPSGGGARAAGAPTPEQMIPLENNEVLASF